ncbi:MAG: hypothetical protein EXR71_11885 [Myxococcales bacterium]|nr:hypothetical protein [Myxococcales bacterium]
MSEADELLSVPVGVGARGRLWLASELAAGLAERIGLLPRGPHTAMLRDLLLRAWADGRSPTLDGMLGEGMSHRGPDEWTLPMHARLELALHFVTAAPEFAGGPPDPDFAKRAGTAREAALTA